VSEEGFLSRWSRRKRAAGQGREEEAPAATPAAVPAAAPAMPAAAPAGPPASGAATDAVPPAAEAEPDFDPSSLPPIESLTAESDFGAFLRKGVPEPLRRAALRKAWGLDPAIRDFVGLADYDWDFNAPDGVPGFALELGGDVQRMLAEAVGFDRFDTAPEREPDREDAAAAAPEVAPRPGDGAAPAEPVPAEPALADAPAIAALPPAGEAAPGAAVAAAPVPRRHGSALPS